MRINGISEETPKCLAWGRGDGPAVERYRLASTSHAGVEHELTIDGADVVCSCAGFEYRGQCRHARDLKAALAAGTPAPAGYSKVG